MLSECFLNAFGQFQKKFKKTLFPWRKVFFENLRKLGTTQSRNTKKTLFPWKKVFFKCFLYYLGGAAPGRGGAGGWLRATGQ